MKKTICDKCFKLLTKNDLDNKLVYLGDLELCSECSKELHSIIKMLYSSFSFNRKRAMDNAVRDFMSDEDKKPSAWSIIKSWFTW